MTGPFVANDSVCFCPLSGILEVIAKRWSLLINAIPGNEGDRGFNELKWEPGCIGPKPLSDSLKKLERTGLVERTIIGTSPPSVRYSLTPDGQALRCHLIPMLAWVSERGGTEVRDCPIRTNGP